MSTVRFRPVSRPDGSPLGGADRDHGRSGAQRLGQRWCHLSDRKLFRIRDLRVQQEFAPDRVPLVRRLAADPTGGIWLGFEDGNLGHYQNGKFEIFPLSQGNGWRASLSKLDDRCGRVGVDFDVERTRSLEKS
jgi:hypothetical protein